MICTPNQTLFGRSNQEYDGQDNVACIGDRTGAYRVLVGKLDGKRRLGRPRHRWKDNTKMNPKEMVWRGKDWIDLVQDRDW